MITCQESVAFRDSIGSATRRHAVGVLAPWVRAESIRESWSWASGPIRIRALLGSAPAT